MIMNYREKMKEYLKEPGMFSSQYGKWGALNPEQRQMIRRLLEEMDGADAYIRELYEENKRLNNIINELEEWLEDNIFNKAGSSVDKAIENHTYCKVLDKLKELKENKYENTIN